MTAEWTRDELLGYVATWSATQKMVSALGPAPYEKLTSELTTLWKDDEKRIVRWPLSIRLAHRS